MTEHKPINPLDNRRYNKIIAYVSATLASLYVETMSFCLPSPGFVPEAVGTSKENADRAC